MILIVLDLDTNSLLAFQSVGFYFMCFDIVIRKRNLFYY